MKFTRFLPASVLGIVLGGCYTLQPVDRATPEIGKEVAVDVSDAGRVALGPSMGPEIGQIHGDLIQRDSDGYVLAVTSVQFLRGGSQTWTGEHIRVKPDYASRYYENRLSPARSIALGAAFVAGAVLVGHQALDVQSGGATGTEPPPPPATKQRAPSGLHIAISPASTARILRRLFPTLRF